MAFTVKRKRNGLHFYILLQYYILSLNNAAASVLKFVYRKLEAKVLFPILAAFKG